MRSPARSAVLALAVAAFVCVPATVAVAAPAGTYVVQAGDFLYAIASRAGISIDALLQANGLKLDTVIVPGQKLTIPAGGRVPTTTATGTTVAPPRIVERAVPTAAGPQSNPQPAGSSTHTVQPGDTVLTLAFRYGVAPDALLKLNKLTMSSVIVIGQKLLLPAGAKPASSGSARVDTVIDAAKAQLGKPYKFGYAGPDYFDCSGLVRFAFTRIGMNLLHNTLLQKNAFPAVPVTDLRVGDLVFFHDDFSHEGMYLGNGLIIHAPAPGQNVMISWIPLTSVTGAVRPIPT